MLPNLAPGTYAVRATAPGFSSFDLSSALFGTSNALASGFGFGPPGAVTNSAAYNRRLEAQMRFSW